MEKVILRPGKGFTQYYTEYPKTSFLATSDAMALAQTKARMVYKKVGDSTILLRPKPTLVKTPAKGVKGGQEND